VDGFLPFRSGASSVGDGSRGNGFRSEEDEAMGSGSGTHCLGLGETEPIASPPRAPIPGARPGPAAGEAAPPETWGKGGPAVRLGLASVRGIGDDLARRIVAERDANGPYAGPEDLVRRVP